MKFKPASLAAQAMGKYDEQTRALILPVHHSTTYQRDADNSYSSGNVYSRADNPTYKAPEELICELEQGAEAILFSSGMAAAVSVFQALTPGDHVIAPKVMYWSLRNWLTNFARHWGLEVELVDSTDTQSVKAAISSRTRLIWLETPANPLWTLSDIEAISRLARQVGAVVAVDSTIATPVFTRPLTLGADIVMHSATKYLNGHSDVISGVLVCRQQNELWQRIKNIRSQNGAVPGPQDAYMLLRGMRTLFLRVRESSKNALYLAEHLAQHPQIKQVLYPGLPDSPDYQLACRQMSGGFGGMLSIRMSGGEPMAVQTAAHCLLWKRATSLGGVESLIEHRASIEGEGTPVPPDLLRLSVGIEDPDDLLNDLLRAMDATQNAV